jgi:trigger factor
MKIQVENVSPVERKVTVEVDPDRVARELEKSYAGLGRRVKLKGFRPGKTPRKVLERHFKGEVEGEVLDRIVQQTFAEAVKVESIPAIAPPHVSVTDGVAEGKPLRYTARVEVKPTVEPRDWRGLEVERREPKVSDDDVQAELTKLQDSLAQLAPVEGRFDAQEGDWAEIDHEGTIDGRPFEGSSARGVTVQIAQGSIAEGNLAALAGKRLGETVELDETFPEDHRNPALRGKVAHMRVTLRALKQRQVPPLDDALAKGLGREGIETLDALRARIREDLEKREKRKAEAEFKDALVKAALARNEFEVPPALVERAIDGMLEGAAERFARSGIDIRKLELDFARMRADLREQALLQVRGALLLEALADSERIEVSEEDLQAEAARIADEMGVPLARVQQQLRGAEPRAALRSRVREEKAVALLASVASIKS